MKWLLSFINIDGPVKVPECYRSIVTTTTKTTVTTTAHAFSVAKKS